MSRSRSLLLLVLFSVLFASGLSAFGQTGSITGQVLDASDRAIPNASLTATSTATGLTQTVTSSSAGLYNFANLRLRPMTSL